MYKLSTMNRGGLKVAVFAKGIIRQGLRIDARAVNDTFFQDRNYSS